MFFGIFCELYLCLGSFVGVDGIMLIDVKVCWLFCVKVGGVCWLMLFGFIIVDRVVGW